MKEIVKVKKYLRSISYILVTLVSMETLRNTFYIIYEFRFKI